MNLTGRVLAGRYQLSRRLAEGGMGSIWMAKHLSLGMNVAVKVMHGDGAARSDLRKRFEQEARAVAMLRSPNVISVIDYGTDGDTPFIVMELLEGIDLLSLLQSAGKWPVPEVANLVQQISKGLSAAHELGLVHRDVKPGNIFLVRTGTDIVVKLLDFGIAKWTVNGVPEQNLTDANVVLGSPYYMSPEQLRCLPLDGRADLWALSVVAYRLITGDLPFTGRDGPEIASRILTRDRKKIQPPIPRALELERFLSRAFADDVGARFKDAKEYADQFILVAGVPSHLRIAERALTSDEEIIPTINLRRTPGASFDDMRTAAEVADELRQQRQQAQTAGAPRPAAPTGPALKPPPASVPRPAGVPRPTARTERMQAVTVPQPGRVQRTPVVRDKKEDSVTSVRADLMIDPLEESSTTDRAATQNRGVSPAAGMGPQVPRVHDDENESSVETVIGTLDDVEDTVTDLPFAGTGKPERDHA